MKFISRWWQLWHRWAVVYLPLLFVTLTLGIRAWAVLPDCAGHLQTVVRREDRKILPRALIATHVRPKDQDQVAAFLAGDRFRRMPRILLASARPAFAIHSDAYRDAGSILGSSNGEIGPYLTVADVTLIGGFEGACLRKTIRELIDNAGAAGLDRIEMTIITEHTYFERDLPNFRALRDGKFSRRGEEEAIAMFFGDQFGILGRSRIPENYEMRLRDKNFGMIVDLTIE